jgi:hypothetical protein
MFTKEINGVTLTNDIADRLFDNITADVYRLDQSFAATLRAVLYGRLPAGESVRLSLVPLKDYATTADIITEEIRQHDKGHSHSVCVVYPHDNDAGPRMLESVRSYIGEGKRYFDSYEPKEDLRLFYVKMLNGLFYTNGVRTLIFLDSLDTRRFHALQMMIPRYLPMLFADAPLSADETALLKSLGLRSSNEYERLIEQFAQRFDMRNEIIRTRLKGFETVFEREQMQAVSRDIDTKQREYELNMSNLRRTMNALQDLHITLAGLQSRVDGGGGDSELMEYFLCNKNLSIIRVQGTALEFVVHGYADIYDEEAAETYIGNPNSYLYNQCIGIIPKESMERFYRAVFLGRTHRLRVCAAYKADMRNSITPLRDYTFPPESQNYIPNSHIQRHGCIGGYAARFMEYMHRRDYVGAIDQATMSARNLNFHDIGVITHFVQTLTRTTLRCVEDAAGNLTTPREAIVKLEEGAECRDPL